MSKKYYPKIMGYRDVTDPHNFKTDFSHEGNHHSREKMRYCPKCKRVWEHVCSTGHMPETTEYYPNVPSYGKPKQTCPGCKLNKGMQNERI